MKEEYTASRELLKDAWLREIGEKIRQARQSRKMSQAQLAKIIGVSQPRIAEIEAGKNNVTIGTLGTILSALAMTLTIEPPKFGALEND